MSTMITYLLRQYVRSNRYFPPLAVLGLCLMMLYSMQPNPVLDSYAASAVMLFFISAWFCYGFGHTEHPYQEMISIVHIKNPNLYFLSKLIAASVLIGISCLFVVLLPVLMQVFDRPVTWKDMLLGLIGHLELAILAACITACFQSKGVGKRSVVLGGLVLTLILSLCQGAFLHNFPDWLLPLSWFIPPAYHVMDVLMNAGKRSNWDLYCVLLMTPVYIGALVLVLLRLNSRHYR
ncbi:hypothetical protein MH117_07500 [Paenibacillus sp. ACRRX]|uniref:hypothetical protein n=1 Tax=unclassified Paenibacillus TaxID=185978 RepID=UPI001EF61D95|nr:MULTISPECIES: hypothetical protein [unclassified Paenibacillus]MCG7407260.1 hypothetical protein [Paenibacillus sp. ACRRX]MDK8180479.1 hypothetical protein [Paenibacillus sp. UMB4589-SE434]